MVWVAWILRISRAVRFRFGLRGVVSLRGGCRLMMRFRLGTRVRWVSLVRTLTWVSILGRLLILIGFVPRLTISGSLVVRGLMRLRVARCRSRGILLLTCLWSSMIAWLLRVLLACDGS